MKTKSGAIFLKGIDVAQLAKRKVVEEPVIIEPAKIKPSTKPAVVVEPTPSPVDDE